MIAEPHYPERMTAQQYLKWEAEQEIRHEYVKGEILAMTGGTIAHNDIALNFYRALYSHFRQKGCRVNVSDVKVKASQNDRYFYPYSVILSKVNIDHQEKKRSNNSSRVARINN